MRKILLGLITGLLLFSGSSLPVHAATEVTVGERLDVPITFTSLLPVGRIELDGISFTNAQLISLDCGGTGLTVSENTADGCTIVAPTATNGAVVATVTIEVLAVGLVEMNGEVTLSLLTDLIGGSISAPSYTAVEKVDEGSGSSTNNNSTTTERRTINSTTNNQTTTGGSNSGTAANEDSTSPLSALFAGLIDSPWAWGILALILLALIVWLVSWITARRMTVRLYQK